MMLNINLFPQKCAVSDLLKTHHSIFVQTHNSKNFEDAVGLNLLTAILGTPVGFILSGQQEIRGSN